MKKPLLSLTFTALFVASSALAAPKDNPNPDFTKGDTLAKDAPHDWTLGPTGARGWIFTANGHSRDARQILVTAVAKGSPADGVLNVGDVILGVDGKSFPGDARVQFAECHRGGGVGEGRGCGCCAGARGRRRRWK